MPMTTSGAHRQEVVLVLAAVEVVMTVRAWATLPLKVPRLLLLTEGSTRFKGMVRALEE